MTLTFQEVCGIITSMEYKCRLKGCSIKFFDEKQRSLHEVNTWHCLLCGFSDGKELTTTNIWKECKLCLFDLVGHPNFEPLCITILVDFKTKRHKRLRKKDA